MQTIDKYLDLNDEQIDNLLLGLNLDKKNNIKNKNVCKNCKSSNLIIDNNNNICNECGVINDEYLDENPDIYNNESEGANNYHYGCPSSFFFPIASLGTKIVSKGYNRLSLLQKQGQMPYKEKSLMDVLENIQNKCKKYNK